ncbi:hypothetical protein GO730_00740 [Spirosoma sp. HMF3257]|uniref:Carboxypeptidase regulatory-like domain-containing protein n=1 Tax=Spirosoma telluris TaxID=2183553 RepID=A0A327NH89_9BACT|nr:hypothetical protein [Spirosoma telluris]RAI73326.1 hypothetical protein HMF3257_00720 [Spirosoma telluris]
MKKSLVLFSIVALLTSCGKSEGSLAGNVFWKYNNFIGNKPDSGSKVHLYPLTNKSSPFKEVADVRGDFRFDKVTVGDYLLIVVSENTNASGEDIYGELKDNSKYLKKVFDYNVPEIKLSGDIVKNYAIITKTINDTTLIRLGFLTHKFRIKPVSIQKDKTTNEVIDFGHTFM